MGLTQEAKGNLAEAVATHENHLSLASKNNNLAAKVQALSSLGRLHHNLGQIDAAVSYLEQALAATEGCSERKEDEAIIRHRLGMALWQQNLDLEAARIHLDKAAMILEIVRRDTASAPRTVDGRLTSNFKMTLFDLQTQCYEALQQVLVNTGRENEALVVAERARTRAFVDLLLLSSKTSNNNRKNLNTSRIDEWTPSNENQILGLVNRQKAVVIYYSIAGEKLYSWLVIPTRGVVKFNQVDIGGQEVENILDEHIQNVRESLGIDNVQVSRKNDMSNVNDNSMDQSNQSDNIVNTPNTSRRLSLHMDALGNKLNEDGDKTGFMRMVNRNSRLNASSYSLSSLFSVGSVNCGSTVSGLTTGSRHGSVRSRRSSLWQGPSAVKALYNLLIEPLEDDLPEEGAEIMLVLDSNLFMVPWSMLRGSCHPEYMCERFNLLITPSLTSTKFKPKAVNKATTGDSKEEQKLTSLVIGNPKLPQAVSDHWGWEDTPKAAKEAETVGEIVQTPSSSLLIGEKATKSAVISQLNKAECIHFACHVSWQLSAIVLSPGEFVESKASSGPSASSPPDQNKRFSTIEEENEEPSEVATSTSDLPALSDFLLTAADILNCKLSAKLVVLSAGQSSASEDGDETDSRKSADGLVALTKAILAAGAQCVVVSLWPVPESATKVVMRALYSSLLQGMRISKAMAEAVVTVQNTKHFAHPANWAGFTIIGSDIRLSNRVALMGQALRQILSDTDSCRDVLRVTLHLVEKSLQRIHRGYKTAMYTSQKSIENKVKASNDDTQGWKDLLMSVGFRFEPGSNGIPPSVFFPQNDPGERLTQCSASLQAILGLNKSSWQALSKLCDSCPAAEASDEIIALFRQVRIRAI